MSSAHEIEPEVRSNARRLRDDATLLLNEQRYTSCCLLQFFALEELGKAFLLRKAVNPDRRGFHGQKQYAAMCLAYGSQSARVLRAKLCELGIPAHFDVSARHADDMELLRNFGSGAVWHWLTSGGWDEFNKALADHQTYVSAARMGTFEYFRRVAAYVDATPDTPAYLAKPVQRMDFGASWAREAMAIIADADAALDDAPAFAVAAAVFARRTVAQ